MRLGIDFGTTRTVVAAADGGRYPVAAFDVGDGFVDYVPGLAALADGQLRTGWAAASACAAGDGSVLRSVKRVVSALGPDDPVEELGVSALELATAFVSSLRALLVERSNLPVRHGEPLEAMVAVPANASSRQRYLTLEAFRRAGFDVVGLVNEPTAAGIDFVHRHLRDVGAQSPKRYVVVYDLGGGTFDTAAVSLRDSRFELLESDGIARLGGDDFDELILSAALETAGEPAGSLSAAARVALLERCRESKERLGPNSRRLLVELGGSEVVLDTAALYDRAQPLVARTLEPLARVFERLPSHGVDPDDPRQLGAVYLVGGAAAFPAVTRALRGAYGRKLKLAPSPHAATAVGLAIAADPDASVFVREAVTRHFGVWREAEDGRDKVFDPILRKDQLPPGGEPLVVTRVYHPAHAVGHLRFLECSRLIDGEPAGDLTPFGELLVAYDADAATAADPEALAEERLPQPAPDPVVETYRYEPDGRVTLEIERSASGYRRRWDLGAP